MDSGNGLLRVGAVLFLVSGLVSTVGEVGDCGGSEAACNAFQVAGLMRTRVLVALLIVMSLLAVATWLSRRWMFPATLLAGSAVVLVLGLASFVVRLPEWMPILIGITIPGSAALMAGAFLRLRFTRGLRNAERVA